MVLALLAGCAASPPAAPLPPATAIQPGDVKSLAGNWEGYVTGSRSGTFTSNLGGAPGAGTFRIVDGKAVYEGANMRGTAALYGSGAQQVLKGEGTWVGSPGQSSFELRRR